MAIFVVMGRATDHPFWAVCYRVSYEDAKSVLDLCRRQSKDLIHDLRTVWTQMDEVETRARVARAAWPRVGRRRFTATVGQELERRGFDEERKRLDKREQEISARHVEDMLDALYPVQTWSEQHEVSYWIEEVPEDPREIGQVGLMKARAKLWGVSGKLDDDNDDTSADDDDDRSRFSQAMGEVSRQLDGDDERQEPIDNE